MKRLLIAKDENRNISKTEFLEDIDCLFEVLKNCYGLYDYFGHERFMAAKDAVIRKLDVSPFSVECATCVLKAELSKFIQDGHFRIGASVSPEKEPDYAVRYGTLYGIDLIQCRKFYYDTPEQEQQLIQFSESFHAYQNEKPLIIDLRNNGGGSDLYIWNFIVGLFGAEPDYPCRYVQNYSELFCAFANIEKYGIMVSESDGVAIPNTKPIYILINEKTASSGESAVAYFKTIENTTIVGTHTAGCFTCGNCMTIYLPNSHIPVYFGTGMVLYEKTRNIDAEGGFCADISYEAFLTKLKNR